MRVRESERELPPGQTDQPGQAQIQEIGRSTSIPGRRGLKGDVRFNARQALARNCAWAQPPPGTSANQTPTSRGESQSRREE